MLHRRGNHEQRHMYIMCVTVKDVMPCVVTVHDKLVYVMKGPTVKWEPKAEEEERRVQALKGFI